MKTTARLILSLLILSPAFSQEESGLIVVGGDSPRIEESLLGQQKALLIGIDHYTGFPALPNCVFDCRAIAQTLREDYGFDEVVEVYDQDATREGILKTLRRVAANLGEKDSLLLYFSGHGIYDDFLDRGYWVPVDGNPEVSTCIPSSEIQTYVKVTPARHVWVVCDSCFSGSLFREKSAEAAPDLSNLDRYVREMIQRKSRIVLAAGGNEPVTADGFDGHSMFAYFFLSALKHPARTWTDSSQIYDQIKVDLANNTRQTPQQGVIFGAGHERGEFFLFSKTKGSEPTEPVKPVSIEKPAAPMPTVSPTTPPVLEGPSVELPGGMAMQLIQIPEADGIWMGKYEVTQTEWGVVASLPRVRRDLPMSPAKTQGPTLPVENISMEEAVEFCDRLSQLTGSKFRLPTEAEWEAACSGAYPEEANLADKEFDRPDGIDGDLKANWDDGFAQTAPVGSFEPNTKGFCDLLGNVSEWCIPDPGSDRVHRGGSWGHSFEGLGCGVRYPVSAKTRPSGFVGFRVVRE
ncbi:MAG: SUMF1/EgtB/PvdO family nonheme iron enzyme [Candidatus Omnitrophica bacterium]|nr:SUMF1/EgtB/PvdO family nonheme iron enzyme [Candidatus Omnitrophota bacterium]